MAEPLKNQFGPDVPRRIAAQSAAVTPAFDGRAFLRDVGAGYDALGLMPRARHIARTLRVYLPTSYVVSEGSRPRLPWAPRLRAFQQNPAPVLELLELLKDDPELYVRRSVANNLNDIGKDHPRLLVATATRWLQGASDERRWIVQHALRSAIKRGDADALAVLGFGAAADVTVRDAQVTPARARVGQSISVRVTLVNRKAATQAVLADLRVHFVKAGGHTSAKTFKLRRVTLAPRGSVTLAKTITLAQLTTRKHYPGVHAVDVLLNGKARRIGSFEIVAP